MHLFLFFFFTFPLTHQSNSRHATHLQLNTNTFPHRPLFFLFFFLASYLLPSPLVYLFIFSSSSSYFTFILYFFFSYSPFYSLALSLDSSFLCPLNSTQFWFSFYSAILFFLFFSSFSCYPIKYSFPSPLTGKTPYSYSPYSPTPLLFLFSPFFTNKSVPPNFHLKISSFYNILLYLYYENPLFLTKTPL